MLHLDVARADAACAMHGEGAPAASHEGMDHHAGAPADEAPCDRPDSPQSCQSFASCAPAVSVTEEAGTTLSPAIVHVTITPAVAERPLSRSTAPEPPPPKA